MKKGLISSLLLSCLLVTGAVTMSSCAESTKQVSVQANDGKDGKDGKSPHMLVFSSQEVESGILVTWYVDEDDSKSVTEADSYYSSYVIPRGPQGPQGIPGTNSYCYTEQAEDGAYLACDDNEPVFIANGTNGVGIPGLNGTNGTSCKAYSAEGGVNIICGEEAPVFLANGATGPQGPPGTPGDDDDDGSGVASITDFTSSSCTFIASGYWGKTASNQYDVYSHSSCHSSTKIFSLQITSPAMWVGSNKYLTLLSPNKARLLTFTQDD